jgi:hypothetical protein
MNQRAAKSIVEVTRGDGRVGGAGPGVGSDMMPPPGVPRGAGRGSLKHLPKVLQAQGFGVILFPTPRHRPVRITRSRINDDPVRGELWQRVIRSFPMQV